MQTKTLKPGTLADAGHYRGESGISENQIPFGSAIKLGTDPASQVKVWDGAAAADKLAGIALCSYNGSDIDNARYDAKRPVSILKEGSVWLEMSAGSAAIVPGDKVAIADDGKPTKGPIVTASGIKATLTIGANNSKVKTTAKIAGVAGNSIKLELIDPGANDASLQVSFHDSTIKVSLATGPAGAITSTAAQVIAAINAAWFIKDLVTAANGAASDGTGVVVAAAAAPLETGADPDGKFGINLPNSEFKTAGNPGDAIIVYYNSANAEVVRE